MSVWLAAATVLAAGLVPLLVVIMRRPAMDTLVALQLFGVMVALVLVLLTEASGDANFADLGLLLSAISVGAGLVYVRFFERWL